MWVADVRSALLCAAVLLATGCPMTNKAATDSYARQVSVATMRVATLEAEVSANEQRVGQIEEAMRAQGAEQVTRLETIDEVNAEVGRIRGDIEVLRFDVTEIKKMLDDLVIEQDRRMIYLETRIAQLEEFLGVKPPPPPTPEELGMVTPGGKTIVAEDGTIVLLPDGDGEATPGEPGEAVPETEIPDTAEGKLELAVSHMEAGRNGVARAILQKAADEHAGDPKMDEIRYRLAETYFNEGNWRKAISEFNAVIEGWPKSPWASWAMLAQGDAFKQWGQADNAKLFYEEVVRVYPKSEAAKEARKLLAQ